MCLLIASQYSWLQAAQTIALATQYIAQNYSMAAHVVTSLFKDAVSEAQRIVDRKDR